MYKNLSPEQLIEELKDDYQNLRKLDDGTVVGTLELAFTRAIVIGLDSFGWQKRFCFENRSLAVSELAKLKVGTDEPDGYIARRGVGADMWYASKEHDFPFLTGAS